MSELKASVVIDLAGNLQHRARQYENSLHDFSRSGSRSMNAVRGSAQLAGRTLDQVGNRFIALATGGAVVAAGKQVTDYSARLNQLGIDAGLNGEALSTFKEKAKTDIAQYAEAWGVNRDEIVSSMEDIIQKTGDLDYANKVLLTNTKIIRASNSQGADIGRVAAEFQKMGLSPEKANEAWDILLKQGKMGAFTVRDMAGLSPRIFAARPVHNLDEVRQTGAFMQTLMASAGSPEQATTSFEAFMRELNDPETLKRLKKARIPVMQKGTHDLLPLPEIINNIVSGTKGDRVKLSGIIKSEEATRGLTRLLDEYRNTGKIASFQDLLKVDGDGSQVIRDASDNLKEAKYQISRLTEAGKNFADLNLAKPVQDLADAINKLPTDKLEDIVGKLMTAGVVVGGAGTAWLGATQLRKLFGSKAPDAASNAVETAAKIAPKASPNWIPVEPAANPWMEGVSKLPKLNGLGGVLANGAGIISTLQGGLIIGGLLKQKYDEIEDIVRTFRDPEYAKKSSLENRARMAEAIGNSETKAKIQIELTGEAASRARVKTNDQNIDVVQTGRVMPAR